MEKEDVFNEICSLKGATQRSVIRNIGMFSKHYPECAENIEQCICSNYVNGMPFYRKLWHYLKNDLDGSLSKCEICGKECAFICFSEGYRSFCSRQCSQKSERTKRNRRDSVIRKYGCINVMQNNTINSKRLETNRIRHGGTGFGSEETSNKAYESIYEEYRNAEGFRKHVSDKLKSYTNINHPDVIGHRNGLWICACTNTECGKCNEKSFEISPNVYHDREKRKCEKCTKLNPVDIRSSYPEKELAEYVSNICGRPVVENERHVLGGMEIDVYIPDLRLGFEFNGDFWHMNPEMYKENDYNSVTHMTAGETWKRDKRKLVEASYRNIVIVTIWESEWKSNRECVEKRISDIIRKHEL